MSLADAQSRLVVGAGGVKHLVSALEVVRRLEHVAGSANTIQQSVVGAGAALAVGESTSLVRDSKERWPLADRGGSGDVE